MLFFENILVLTVCQFEKSPDTRQTLLKRFAIYQPQKRPNAFVLKETEENLEKETLLR